MPASGLKVEKLDLSISSQKEATDEVDSPLCKNKIHHVKEKLIGILFPAATIRSSTWSGGLMTETKHPL